MRHLINSSSDALLDELRAMIEAKLEEPSPSFVYSILLASKIRNISERLQRIGTDASLPSEPLRSTLAELQAIANIVEECELRLGTVGE